MGVTTEAAKSIVELWHGFGICNQFFRLSCWSLHRLARTIGCFCFGHGYDVANKELFKGREASVLDVFQAIIYWVCVCVCVY